MNFNLINYQFNTLSGISGVISPFRLGCNFKIIVLANPTALVGTRDKLKDSG